MTAFKLTVSLFVGLTLCPAAGAATSVTLQGMLGHKALLLIDGQLRTLGPGDSTGGVRVLSTTGDQAVIEADGARHTLRVGDAPASVGGDSGASDRVVLTADAHGNFFGQGSIEEGKPVQFIVDTGATWVAIGQPEADRLGLHYQNGPRLASHTANGTTVGWSIRLQRLSVGGVTVYDVEAAVLPAALPVVLLGNSFLNRFRMEREADRLVLIKR